MESLKESYFFAQYRKEFGDKTAPDSSKLQNWWTILFFGVTFRFVVIRLYILCHLNDWEPLRAFWYLAFIHNKVRGTYIKLAKVRFSLVSNSMVLLKSNLLVSFSVRAGVTSLLLLWVTRQFKNNGNFWLMYWFWFEFNF